MAHTQSSSENNHRLAWELGAAAGRKGRSPAVVHVEGSHNTGGVLTLVDGARRSTRILAGGGSLTYTTKVHCFWLQLPTGARRAEGVRVPLLCREIPLPRALLCRKREVLRLLLSPLLLTPLQMESGKVARFARFADGLMLTPNLRSQH